MKKYKIILYGYNNINYQPTTEKTLYIKNKRTLKKIIKELFTIRQLKYRFKAYELINDNYNLIISI